MGVRKGDVTYCIPSVISMSFRPVYCGKTADCIWMSNGVVGRLGPRMRHVDKGGDRTTGRGNFGGGRGASYPIVNKGDFVA